MHEVLATAGWIGLGFVAVFIYQTRIPRCDTRYIWACFWAHIISAFVLIWLVKNVLGGGDIEMYYFYGEALADWVRRDPGRWTPEVIRLILQMDAEIPTRLYSQEGSSTTSLIGLTALLMVINRGSEFGTAIFFSLLAFSGQMAMYAAFRNHFGGRYRIRLLIALLLVPSVVFWTSGVVKEAVAIAGMGWIVLGLHQWIVDRRRISGLIWVLVGAVVVSFSKAYVLFPLAVAGGVWWFWHHSLSSTGSVAIAKKPIYMLGASLVAVVGVLGLGELFPQYSIETLGEEAAQMQQAGAGAGGGSYYGIGNPDETSLVGQLAFAPMALTAVFFRPFIFEAHNLVALINGLEMTVILWMWLRILRRHGARRSWHIIRQSPALVFCVVFAVLCALGVGLATTNLGTLSRYRVPMMPMYILVLVMLFPMERGVDRVDPSAAVRHLPSGGEGGTPTA